MDGTIQVQVVYARPGKQVVKTLEVAAGTTLQDAIAASRIHDDFKDLEIDPDRLGIFGQKARLDQALRNGDRVEIYRPLIADPKEARRERAAAKK